MMHRPKILVVEKDPPTLRQLEATLKTMGADPRCLASSKKAAELVGKEKFDGAFLDWDTPEMSGEELTKRIRASRSNSKIPIAMFTERKDTHSITQGFKLGVTFYLAKPAGVKELERLLTASRGAMLDERRRYQRAPLKAPVVCAWDDKKVHGQAVDVSIGGILATMAPPPPMGTDVTVEFALPRIQAPFSLKATVVRSGQQVGMKFLASTTSFLIQGRVLLVESAQSRNSGGGIMRIPM